jgi:hypothetical protein
VSVPPKSQNEGWKQELMRSSKSRSRGKNRNNNGRSPANNINRVFDSSGPEGKVRGTPQQIIDKYSQLARDAFMGNDRVAAENFQQHAEHYTRLLAEAQRDAEEKRQQSEQQNRDRQQQQQKHRERDQREDQSGAASQPDQTDRPQRKPAEQASPDFGSGPQPELVNVDARAEADSGLVETPESAPKKPPRPRKPRVKKPVEPVAAKEAGETPEAAQ